MWPSNSQSKQPPYDCTYIKMWESAVPGVMDKQWKCDTLSSLERLSDLKSLVGKKTLRDFVKIKDGCNLVCCSFCVINTFIWKILILKMIDISISIFMALWKIYLSLLSVWFLVLPACCMCTICMECLWKPEEDVRSHGTAVADGCWKPSLVLHKSRKGS